MCETDTDESDEDDRTPLIARLVEVREKLGLRQKDMATLLGMAPATCSRFESRGYDPTGVVLSRYVRALGGRLMQRGDETVRPELGGLRIFRIERPAAKRRPSRSLVVEAVGVVWPDGAVTIRWAAGRRSSEQFDDIGAVMVQYGLSHLRFEEIVFDNVHQHQMMEQISMGDN